MNRREIRLRRSADHVVPKPPLGRPAIGGATAGLTLIEMVVALALAMLVVVFLAQGTGMIRHFVHIARAFPIEDQVLAIRDHLRRQISAMQPTSGALQQSAFAGVADTVVFTAPGDRLLETGGPVRITLTALPEARGITLAETRAPQNLLGGAKGRTTRLIEGAVRVDLAYFGAQSGDASPIWSDEWTDPEFAPSLVRIDVQFQPGDPRHWAPFAVYLPTGATPKASSKTSLK